MHLSTFGKNFDDIISSYSQNAGNAIQYCTEENGEAFKVMREASENALQDIKSLLFQYLHDLQ